MIILLKVDGSELTTYYLIWYNHRVTVHTLGSGLSKGCEKRELGDKKGAQRQKK